MKITDVNLDKPHYVIIIAYNYTLCRITKQTSEIKEKLMLGDIFYEYKYILSPINVIDYVNGHTYCVIKDINEDIYQGNNYVKFNLKDITTNYYITYDKFTAYKLILKHYMKEYHTRTMIRKSLSLSKFIKQYGKETLQQLKSMK